MSRTESPIRWSDVLEKKPEATLPFLRYYRDAGLVPENKAKRPAARRRKPAL